MVEISVILVCILINGVFSGFEMGLVTVKRSSLQHLHAKGSSKAAALLKMREQLEKTLSTIQIGITVVAIISGVMAGRLASNFGSTILITFGVSKDGSESLAMLFFVVLITYVTVVLGELLPKIVAAQFPARIIYFFHRTIVFVTYIFRPFVKVLEGSCAGHTD